MYNKIPNDISNVLFNITVVSFTYRTEFLGIRHAGGEMEKNMTYQKMLQKYVTKSRKTIEEAKEKISESECELDIIESDITGNKFIIEDFEDVKNDITSWLNENYILFDVSFIEVLGDKYTVVTIRDDENYIAWKLRWV